MDNTGLISGIGTVTIPKAIREKFGYTPGLRIYLYELDGLLIVSKEKIDNVEEKFFEDEIRDDLNE